MPAGPYLPVFSISRSQNIRIGRGPGNMVANEFNSGDILTNPQTGGLITLCYINLGDPNVRKDLQHHSAIGGIIEMGTAAYSPQSDLFVVSGLGVTAGTGYALNIAAGTLQSRFYGGQLAVSAQTVTPAAPSATDRTDLVLISNTGVVTVATGVAASAAAVYEVDSVATSGVPTGGNITLQFVYNGYNYVTGNIAFNATAAAVASAIAGATSTNGGRALPGTLTGTGGPLTTAAVTVTASAGLEGAFTGQSLASNTLTGGASPSATFTRTTQGSGGSLAQPWPGGNTMTLAELFVPATATSSANYTIDTVALTS